MWDRALKDKTITQKQIVQAIWDENKLHAEQITKHGKRSVRYSAAAMQFAIQCKLKLGNGQYAMHAACTGGPSLRTVQRALAKYSSAAYDPNGGILYSNI